MKREELEFLRDHLHELSELEQVQTLELLTELEQRSSAEKCRLSLLDFVMAVDPDYKIGVHHRQLAEMFEDMAFGRKARKRITVNIAPRFGKSQLTSIYFPAWFIGNFPNKKIMMISHTADLAVDFGRKVRNVVDTELYHSIFPGVTLAADSKSAGRWNTNQKGEYFAVGIGGAIAGRGADLMVIDDPHNEQDILAGNFEVFEKAYNWYAFGARPRLMPGACVAIVMTRWALNDLTGKLIVDMAKNPDADQWEVVEFPALLNAGTSTERSLWPEQWPTEELLRTKASMPPFQWNAQYMQQPTSSEAAIIKKEWWQEWLEKEPPLCEYIIQALDTAAEKNNRADFTSLTTWGVFTRDNPEDGTAQTCIMLLDAFLERVEYPQMKRMCLRKYEEFQPDWFIVEKKNSGAVLYQEMRANGLPVQEFTPTRATGDKVARLNAVSDIFSSGLVWYPKGRRWADEVVDQVCAFPAAGHDDHVDTTSMAISRFRTGGFIRLPTDEIWNDDDFEPVVAHYYLWPLLIGFSAMFTEWGFNNVLC